MWRRPLHCEIAKCGLGVTEKSGATQVAAPVAVRQQDDPLKPLDFVEQAGSIKTDRAAMETIEQIKELWWLEEPPAPDLPFTMMIERYMPAYDVRDFHELRVRAPVDTAYDELRSVNLERSWIIRTLFGLRTLPARIMGKAPPPQKYGTFLEQALAIGWVILEETPGRDLVAGAVTQPWVANVRFRGLPANEFVQFAEPGFTKIAWSMAARPVADEQTILSMETRVLATDPASRRKFRRYWFFVSPGVRLIRWIALRMVRRELHRKDRSA